MLKIIHTQRIKKQKERVVMRKNTYLFRIQIVILQFHNKCIIQKYKKWYIFSSHMVLRMIYFNSSVTVEVLC